MLEMEINGFGACGWSSHGCDLRRVAYRVYSPFVAVGVETAQYKDAMIVPGAWAFIEQSYF